MSLTRPGVGYISPLSEYGSLKDILQTDGDISRKDAIGFMSGIVNGLMFLASHGLPHMNLKSRNVMVNNQK